VAERAFGGRDRREGKKKGSTDDKDHPKSVSFRKLRF